MFEKASRMYSRVTWALFLQLGIIIFKFACKCQSCEPYLSKQPDPVNVMKNGCILSGLFKTMQSKCLTRVRKWSVFFYGGFLSLGKLRNTFPLTCNLMSDWAWPQPILSLHALDLQIPNNKCIKFCYMWASCTIVIPKLVNKQIRRWHSKFGPIKGY